MKASLIRIVFLGVAAGMCLSAYAAPSKKSNDKVATKCASKCSKGKQQQKAQKPSRKSAVQADADARPNPGKFYWPKKSAARKVLEG
jgi:hypothetical protein